MFSDTILISAPYAARSLPSSATPWNHYIPFQPLLGFDAQMAGFVALMGDLTAQIRCLAAPDIAPASEFLPKHAPPPIHVRFGPLRACRLCKAARNIAILAENPHTLPTKSGFHPFSLGTIAPKGLSMALTYEPLHHTPTRIDSSPIRIEHLPSAMAEADLSALGDADPPPNLTLQSGQTFTPNAWIRRSPAFSPEPPETSPPLPKSPCILVPWNLAHAGSLVPDLLAKTQMLASANRCPITLLVLPYNDEPEGLTHFMQHASTAQTQSVLFARAHTLPASLSLLRLCNRAWIDATDPETSWTTHRLRRLGLPINIVSKIAPPHPEQEQPHHLAPDEEICVGRNAIAAPLSWRSQTLSPRRLSALMAAILRGEDDPLPAIPSSSNDNPAENMAAILSVMGALADA